ncbi:putative cytokinin riboside 5'-monophosphate phosphoribohydrolase [Luteitalea sp. TBR-22]|uniref:LOG family protein n=1 Tax=Luteitalea sp. TBR-22 TaxID=2802971 RepID=UPI001AF9D016|nr:TIGR00730 family Rossman fold protein [Luteitalea sp. TBR-22]BCS35413.1 putative cytokinin riboside 5'-monophosphate phosphoribohydrolase [Luteitalea sp. TBR-22]
MTLRSVCVYCASSLGADPRFAEAARTVGTTLARRGIRLVYGGGRVGLMGMVADAALAAGGEVVGVIPAFLQAREVHHTGVTELLVVESMHARKAAMADRADAFIALPGGFGTFEEFFEVITWTQLDLQRKPVGLLNVAGFYDGLLAFIDHARAARLVREEHRAIVSSADRIDELLAALEGWAPNPTPKWRGELS